MLTVHRVRNGFVEERTATINRVRGLMSEFGIVLPLKAETVRRNARRACERLPAWAGRAVGDLLDHITTLDQRIDEYDTHLMQLARSDERSERLMQLAGIGPMTATALLASIGNGHDFKNGRQLAAWLGLVPGRHGSGGKTRLGRITKTGDRYLRTLLVLGARSLLANTAIKNEPSRSRPANWSCLPAARGWAALRSYSAAPSPDSAASTLRTTRCQIALS
jgi:transposase